MRATWKTGSTRRLAVSQRRETSNLQAKSPRQGLDTFCSTLGRARRLNTVRISGFQNTPQGAARHAASMPVLAAQVPPLLWADGNPRGALAIGLQRLWVPVVSIAGLQLERVQGQAWILESLSRNGLKQFRVLVATRPWPIH